MITRSQFKPAFGLTHGSLFCMKVETYLCMMALAHESALFFIHFSITPARSYSGRMCRPSIGMR